MYFQTQPLQKGHLHVLEAAALAATWPEANLLRPNRNILIRTLTWGYLRGRKFNRRLLSDSAVNLVRIRRKCRTNNLVNYLGCRRTSAWKPWNSTPSSPSIEFYFSIRVKWFVRYKTCRNIFQLGKLIMFTFIVHFCWFRTFHWGFKVSLQKYFNCIHILLSFKFVRVSKLAFV